MLQKRRESDSSGKQRINHHCRLGLDTKAHAAELPMKGIAATLEGTRVRVRMFSRTLAFFATWILLVALLDGCATKPKPETKPLPATTTFWGVSARILDYGLCKSSGPEVILFHPHVPNKTFHARKNPPVFIKTTDEIPGVVNTHFGISFELTGLPPRRRAYLMLRTSHPAIRSPDGRVTTRHQWPYEPLVGTNGVVRSYMAYQFDEPYEIAPGDWVTEVFLGGLPALKQTFHVSAPKQKLPKATN